VHIGTPPPKDRSSKGVVMGENRLNHDSDPLRYRELPDPCALDYWRPGKAKVVRGCTEGIPPLHPLVMVGNGYRRTGPRSICTVLAGYTAVRWV